jgi:hypothetical protein
MDGLIYAEALWQYGGLSARIFVIPPGKAGTLWNLENNSRSELEKDLELVYKDIDR